jgi:FkbM family methyltransferase
MGLIKNNLNRIGTQFFNPKYYILLKLILIKLFKNKGITRFNGWKVKYNDASSLIGMYNEIIYNEHYRFIPKNEYPLIIDCGSNIGISVLYFYETIRNVYIVAIEADPEISSILKENLISNNCKAEIIQKVIWTTNDEELSFGSIGADAGSLFSLDNTKKIKSIRLKDLLEKYDAIELLKIDIEGAEIKVIKDCENNLSHVNKVFVEYHSFSSSEQELDILLSIMTKNGFRYKILPARKEQKPFLTYLKQEKMDLQLNIFFYRI